jgi:uncharacterized protein YggE
MGSMTVLWLFLALSQASGETPQIRVTGRAELAVDPEEAEVDVGVVTEAAEAQEASRRNAEKLDATLKSLREALGPAAKFETVSYSLHPVYNRPEPRSEPVVTGYTATNVVRVLEIPLDSVGKVIDVATSAGANTVRNIAFRLKDEEGVRARALRLAAADARGKADALAEALGVRIVRILSVIEGEPDVVRPMPMYRAELAMAEAAPTPVEPGSIEIRASVTLVVEISP